MMIAIAQMNTTPGAFDATVGAMAAYGRRAAELGAELVVYPAPALMGPDPMSLVTDEAYQLDAMRALGQLAEKLEVPALVPFTSSVTGTPTLDVAYVRDGGVVPLSLAGMLGSPGNGGTDRVLQGVRQRLEEAAQAQAPGMAPAQLMDPIVVPVGDVNVGVALSMDDLDPFCAGDLEADVICLLPVDGYDTDDEMTALAPSVSDGCFVREADEADAWLVVAGAAGAYEDMAYCGGSFVMAPWGELAAVAPSFAEDLLVCDMDVLSEGPLAEPVEPPAYDRAATLWHAMAASVRDQVRKRGLSGVALLADGTLSSSVVAALAVDAVGPLRVHALVCAEGEALEDARELVRSLRVRDVDELPVRDVARAADALGGEDADALGAALVGARLGELARTGSLLCLSSADKTLLAVGPGEGRPLPVARPDSFAPLGDVYRSDVAREARWRNTVSPVIPARALTRLCVPAGLGLEAVAQTDELRLSELDALLLLRIERGASMAELCGSRLGERGVSLVLDRMRGLEGWRRQGPLCPVVSARSLGEAQRPVADAWRDHVADASEAGAVASAMASALGALRSRAGRAVAPGPRGVAPGPAAAGDATPGEAGPTLSFSIPDELKGQMGSRVSELMGYLKELSDGSRLRGETGRGGKPGAGGMWPGGMFSDN